MMFKTEHGIQCCGLIDKVLFIQRLNSIILKVFSNSNDAIIQ